MQFLTSFFHISKIHIIADIYFMMTCHFKPTMTLADEMQRAQNFEATAWDNLANPAGNHQRKRLDVILAC